MLSDSSLRAASCATISRSSAFLSCLMRVFTVSSPSDSTAAPAFEPFQAEYAANLAPIAAQSASVITLRPSARATALTSSNCAAQAGLTGSSRLISAFPTTLASGYVAIWSSFPVRLSALIDAIEDVWTSRDAVLSGVKAASFERIKKSFTLASRALYAAIVASVLSPNGAATSASVQAT